jgi:hypothetical protein
VGNSPHKILLYITYLHLIFNYWECFYFFALSETFFTFDYR